MSIEYRTNYPIAVEAVAELFRQSGIRRPVDELDRIQQMIDHANLTVTAWDGDKMVGIGRALTDFSFCCYLSDLAVVKDYQRKGIGLEIVDKIQEALGDGVMLLLLAAPEAMAYYPKIGFDKADNAWIIHRPS
jgi:predicted N-acetyltransferase YhbS